MGISSWSIRNPIPSILLFLILTFAGLFSYKKMSINNMPSVVVPMVSVQITQPGASASEIEKQVTKKVEGSLAGMQGVKHITSVISEGYSNTTIEFQLDVEFDRAVNDSRDAVSKVREQLPKTIQEPIIQRLEIDGGAILIYSIIAPEMRTEDLSWFIDDTLNRELLSVKGVASIKRDGGTDHEITINLDPRKISSYGVTASEISQQIAKTNVDLPGGHIEIGGVEYSLRTLGNADSAAALSQTKIALPNGKFVKLADLGSIQDGTNEVRKITKIDKRPVITFQVYRTKGSSEVDVANKVDKKLEKVAEAYPNIKFQKIFSLVTFTENSFKSTKSTFIEGTILTILVVFFFLRDFRATVIAAITIPLSIIPTFYAMDLFGFSLNAVTFLAISLVTGVLVDDAIVEIENIHRHMESGKSPFVAALEAVEEIGLAVVATTLVICAVFVPVSFMDGVPGQFFKQFGLTVAISAFFSLIVARLLTPVLCAYFLKKPQHHHIQTASSGKYNFSEKYQNLINWTLDNRKKTLLFAGISMVLSFAIIPLIPSGFIPYEDYSQSKISIELPKGATLQETENVAQKAADIVQSKKEVEYVLLSIGTSTSGMTGPGTQSSSSSVNMAELNVKLKPKNERDIDQKQFENLLLPELKNIPDVKISFANSSGAKDIIIALVSDDDMALEKAAIEVEKQMRQLTTISSVSSSAGQIEPEIIIKPDFNRMAMLGISSQQLAEAVKIATIGDIESNLAKFNYNNRQIPIRVRLPVSKKYNLANIKNLVVASKNGKRITLSSIAKVEFAFGPTVINRYDRQRKVSLEANLNGVALGAALEQIYNLPAVKNLPNGLRIQNTGDAEMMGELFASFGKSVLTGLLMVYAIQVLLYKDWIQPFTRMAALPLSIGGAFFLLLLTNTDLSMPAVIGLLMLMGIADKNSILLVDFILDQIRAGVPVRQAIIDSCRVRARPIIMTSIAMLAGMMPIALGFGLDSAFRAPMAIAVIGGLISSTALSLIFVPVLFSYVKDFESWLFPKLKKLSINLKE